MEGKDEILSSRIFRTFLSMPEPFQLFDAYARGFNKGRGKALFDEVRKRDHVFCYQINEGYVGLCEVKYKTRDAPGGRCLVLAKIQVFCLVKKLTARGSVQRLHRKASHEALGESTQSVSNWWKSSYTRNKITRSWLMNEHVEKQRQEERRQEEVALQKKQLFAQRVAAAAAVASAVNIAQTAEAVEKMRREASAAAEATARHQRLLEIQQLEMAARQEQMAEEQRITNFRQTVLTTLPLLKEEEKAPYLIEQLLPLVEKRYENEKSDLRFGHHPQSF